jgi:hypothetical protein
MNMSAIENQAHSTRKGDTMKRILILYFLLFFLIGCGDSSSDSSCTECGGGLLDGYLYKEVTVDDIAGLTNINVTAEIGKCIRFKLDGEDFNDAEVVDDCCCVEYQ